MRNFFLAMILVALAACADSEPQDRVEQVQVAVVVPPKPRIPKPDLIGRFACDGSILHPSIESKIESPVRFWFDVLDGYSVSGQLEGVGSPLDLPGGKIAGRLAPKFNTDGRLIGGMLVVTWPHVRDNAPTEFNLMRETFVRAGQTINGVGQVIRRTSDHTYLSARVWLDPKSNPAVVGFRRAAFLNATCFPEIDLPTPRPAER